jgi:hypothetical protein
MIRVSAGPLCALCIALALAGCGGGDNGQSAGSTTSRPSEGQRAEKPVTATKSEPRKPASGAEPSLHAGAGSTTADAGPPPGTKSVAPGVPVQPGGDNSVQKFGVEGETGQREQALAALRTYLDARAAGQWARACAMTSDEFKEQAAQLVAMAPQKEEPEDCAATLGRFLGGIPRSELRRSAVIKELLSFRVKDGYAYVIFKGAGDEVRFIAMANDDGEWKVNTTEPGTFDASG